MNATIDPATRPAADPHATPAALSVTRERRQTHGSGGSAKWLIFFFLLALVVVGGLLWKRNLDHEKLAAGTSALNVTTVNVTHAKAGPSENEITLPGNLTAYSEASIFARTNGYLKSWSTDIGAKVKANQVMAEIEAPDVDAQLRQADATLSQARANLDIANLNFARQQDLLAKKVASQQEYDQNRTNVDAMKAAVQAAQANMQNLTVMKDFQLLRAPFDGVVTKRNTDVGSLISASNGGQELFRVARTDILRVYVYVPQVYAAFVQEGSTAYLDFAEFPGEKFEGKVAHIAGAIDPATRTLETEVEVDNKNGRLFPGAFANVHLSLPLKKAPMVVPVNTLIFRSEGTQVAVVGNDGVVHLRNVTVGQDYGTSLEITSGITPADSIIVNPSDSLADGAKVQISETANATATGK
jgi:RND family efflux transporter MFP subunit